MNLRFSYKFRKMVNQSKLKKNVVIFTCISTTILFCFLLQSSHLDDFTLKNPNIVRDTSKSKCQQPPSTVNYNVTPNDALIIIYNRVPKCASSTLQKLFKRLSSVLDYQHISSEIYDERLLDSETQEMLVKNLTEQSMMLPLSYDRHLYYIDFTRFSEPRPVYVNMVRDPVSRFTSSFYYRRSSQRISKLLAKGLIDPPTQSWLNQSLENCVFENYSECQFIPGTKKESIVSYFCGQEEFCLTFGDARAQALAQATVSGAYSVVGFVDELSASLAVMERLAPRFMANASAVYGGTDSKSKKINQNAYKPRASLAVRTELAKRMQFEITFYEFLKSRFEKQKQMFL